MTESELRFILSAQDEGLKKGILEAEKAVQGLDSAVLQLAGTQLQYNTAAQWFVDNSGRYVAQEKALNQAGIITSKQLQDQIRLLDQLIVQEQRDSVVTQQLIERKQALQKQYGLLDAAQVTSGSRTRLNSQIYFQAGQTISDFAIAGVRGAANNIEFLAASLGASAPLMIGISLVSAAFFVFGDDIAEALDPVGKQIEDLKGKTLDFIKILEDDRPSLALFRDQVPRAIETTQERVNELEVSLRGPLTDAFVRAGQALAILYNVPKAVTGKGINIIDSAIGTDDDIRRIAIARASLNDFRTDQAKFEEESLLRSELEEDQLIKNNQVRLATIRLDLQLLGLTEKAKGLSEDELLLLDKKAGIKGIIAEITKDEVSETKKLEEALAEVRRQIELAYGAKKTSVELLKEEIELEKERLKRLEKIRAAQEQIAEAQRIVAGATGVRPVTPLATPPTLKDIAEQAKVRRKDTTVFDSSFLTGEDANDKLVEQFEEENARILDAQRAIIEGTDRTGDAFRRAQMDAATFYTSTREGQVALQETIAASVGSISGSFADLFQSMAESGKKGSHGLFAAYKAFATAQAIINTYQAASKALAEGGPFLGPILAAAAIVQGGILVAKIAATKPGSTSVSGGGGSGARTPTVTALGFADSSPLPGRAALSRPVGSVSGASQRARVDVNLIATESYTPAGDRVRSFRQALATDAKKGGSGKL